MGKWTFELRLSAVLGERLKPQQVKFSLGKGLASIILITMGLALLQWSPRSTWKPDALRSPSLNSLDLNISEAFNSTQHHDRGHDRHKGQRLELDLATAEALLRQGDSKWTTRYRSASGLWCEHPDGRSYFYSKQGERSVLRLEIQSDEKPTEAWPKFLPKPHWCRVVTAQVLGGRHVLLAEIDGGLDVAQESYQQMLKEEGWLPKIYGARAGEMDVFQKEERRCLLHWSENPQGSQLALVIDHLDV